MLLELVHDWLRVGDTIILTYFFLMNSSYLVLIGLAAAESGRHIRRVPFSGFEELYRSPLTEPVSVLVPAYNEEAGIVESVRAILALRYPLFEVVVVDDGSSDATFARLRAEFDLVEVPRVIPDAGLLVISGAFGVFRRDTLLEVGGLDHGCIGEDAELVVRLHRYLRQQRRDYRIVFVAEPVSWSETPNTVRVLARQRRRWHRGIAEILLKHRTMLANPRYGRIGLVALPYYLVFELWAPMVELAGVVLVPLGMAMHAVDIGFAWRFLLIAYGYTLLINLTALAVEEYLFHRYTRWRDLGAAVLAAVLENIGYRQLTAVWRLQGAWAAMLGRRQVWGVMTRQGFAPAGTGTRTRTRTGTTTPPVTGAGRCSSSDATSSG